MVMYELEKEGMLLLALKEIKLCQSVSAGASFVVGLVLCVCVCVWGGGGGGEGRGGVNVA